MHSTLTASAPADFEAAIIRFARSRSRPWVTPSSMTIQAGASAPTVLSAMTVVCMPPSINPLSMLSCPPQHQRRSCKFELLGSVNVNCRWGIKQEPDRAGRVKEEGKVPEVAKPDNIDCAVG